MTGETKPREAPRAEQPVVMQVEAERVEYYRGLGDAELYQAMRSEERRVGKECAL